MALSGEDDLRSEALARARREEIRGCRRSVEFALSLPPSWLVSPWPAEGKRLLRDVVRPHLPPGILNCPKQGFVVPLNSWLQTHFLSELKALCLVADSHITSLLNVVAILSYEGLGDTSRQAVYALLVLEMWLQHLRNVCSEVVA